MTNIIHAGIVILEFICPISLTNLSFGMVSEKDLETNNVSKQFKTFKTSSRRNLIMKINYWNKTCSFYLNDTKISSLNFFEEEKIPIVLIKKKSTCVILNPLVKYLFTTYDTIFTKEILFKLEKKEYLNLDKTGQNNNFVKYQNYFKNSFNKQFDLKYVLGDINDKGEVCNFICARFDDKFTLDLKDNFSKICINKNLSIIDKKDLKQIKINLVNTAHLNYLNDVAYFSKIKSKFTKAEKDEENKENKENKEKDNNIVENVVKYIIENFENININMKESFAELKEQFKNLKERKNLLEDLKPYSDKGSNGKGNHNSFIDYVKNDDCLLMINTNKIKIIKREENGVFDVTNFLDLKNINNENNKKCIIFDKQDLLFFLQNFDVKEYINYFPSFNKIYCLFSFLKSVKNANTLGKNKILLLQENSEYFYNSIISYLNFSAFITRSHKILAKKMKQSDKEKDKNLNLDKDNSYNSIEDEPLDQAKIEKENLNFMNLFPFAYSENDIENEENPLQIFEESSDNNSLNYNDYIEFISKNPLVHTKLVKIINKIIAQLSIREPDIKILGNNNMFNAYENMASFINYPFITKEPDFPLTSLSDSGFYCENAFTNELKLYDYHNNKLIDTDMLTSQENIELYLKENFPTYIPNSPLKDISPIINSSYIINNMNFTEEEEKVELYHINEKYPILATCTKQGIDNNIH